MLTYDETVGAIKALGTDSDIIKRACLDVIRGGKIEYRSVEDIVSEIIATYSDDNTKGAAYMTKVGLHLAALVSATTVKLNSISIPRVYETLRDGVAELYTEFLAQRLMKESNGNVDEVVTQLYSWLEKKVAEAKRG